MTPSLRRRLKSNPLAFAINAWLKNTERAITERAASFRHDNDATRAALQAYEPTRVREMTLARMARDSVRAMEAGSSPTIFCVGTYYEQEAAGFVQALGAAGRLVEFRNANGLYGLEPARPGLDVEVRHRNGRCLIEQVDAAAARYGRVDVVIGTIVAQTMPIEALAEVRRRGIPVLNIAMDDRLADHWGKRGGVELGAIGLAAGTDVVLQTTYEYLGRYMARDCPALYWPFGSDPQLFGPRDEPRYDVCFVGNNYGWRAKFVSQLKRAGIRVECFGHNFDNGHIDALQVAEVFGRSKIILGIGTVGYSKRVVTLKLRDFDGPMSGRLYITTDNPDLHRLYDVGKEIETYRSWRECLDKIRAYLADDEARNAISRAGRQRAERDHTWNKRIKDAFETISV